MSSDIQCTLTENALDYLLLADELARLSRDDLRGESHKLKHALATLTDGLELLLKARVEVSNWEFLFEEAEKVDQAAYESGNFRSISMKNLPDILKLHCGVTLRTGQQRLMGKLANQRNKIRHFAISVERAVVASLIVRGFSFALDFIHDHLQDQTHDDSFPNDVARLREASGRNQEFVTERLRNLRAFVANEIALEGVNCPVCDQECLCVDGSRVSCRFCRHQNSARETAIDLACAAGMRLKDIEVDSYVWQCPECEAEACVQTDSASATHVCLNCGEAGTYSNCEHCDRLFVPVPYDDEGHESWVCNECEQERFEEGD